MLLRKLLRHRGLGMNLLASLCLLALFVYAWDLDLGEMLTRLLLILLALALVIAAAGLLGGLLYWLRRRHQAPLLPGEQGAFDNADTHSDERLREEKESDPRP